MTCSLWPSWCMCMHLCFHPHAALFCCYSVLWILLSFHQTLGPIFLAGNICWAGPAINLQGPVYNENETSLFKIVSYLNKQCPACLVCPLGVTGCPRQEAESSWRWLEHLAQKQSLFVLHICLRALVDAFFYLASWLGTLFRSLWSRISHIICCFPILIPGLKGLQVEADSLVTINSFSELCHLISQRVLLSAWNHLAPPSSVLHWSGSYSRTRTAIFLHPAKHIPSQCNLIGICAVKY